MASNQENTNELITVLHNIARGDEKAIQFFYQEHYNTFITFGHTITRDRHAIEDAIQNFLIWVIENPRRIRKLDRPDVYLYRSLRNNLIREQTQSRKLVDSEIKEVLTNILTTKSAEKKWMENEEEQEIIQMLQKEISALPDYLQQTLYLRYFSDMAYKDIAEVLDVKPNVTRVYMHRAIERLRAAMKGEGSV